MKNSIVSASIFFNSIESLYKYHYKVRHYNLPYFLCMYAESQIVRCWLSRSSQPFYWQPTRLEFCWGRGFKSHPVHFFLLYNYGIKLSLFWWL
jgi:hypothetical protein